VYLVDLSETEESRCARSEGIGKSYASRILRLALLARDIVEAILSGRTHQALMLEQLGRPLPRAGRRSVNACSAHARRKNNKRLRVRDALHAGVGADTVKHGL
jgi:hypothetical protein